VNLVRLLAAALAVALLASCAGTGPAASPSQVRHNAALIVDSDMDSSDVMALPYLLAQPDLKILAITVPATGVAHCPVGAVHAASLVEMMQRDIPVACGSGSDRSGVHAFPDWLRSFADDAYGLNLDPPARPPFGDAVALLDSALSDAAEPVTILTLGPLTNIAQLLEQHPDSASRIASVVMMGGAFDVAGNVEADAAVGDPEWNIWADPAAARAVVTSGIPITMVPLDATADVPVTADLVTHLQGGHDAVAADLAYELMVRNPVLATGSQFFWDQLTAVALDHPEVLRTERLHVTVTTDGAAIGRTLRDASAVEVAVALGADRDAFMNAFLPGLRRGPMAQSPFVVRATYDVAWDGASCSATGSSPSQAGPAAVVFSDATGSAGLLVVTVHDHAWADVQAFVAQYTPGTAVPDYIGVTPIEARSPLHQVVDLAEGAVVGFACATMDAGQVAAVVLSRSFEVHDGH
jgi:pyrimidine-specific ribonucleoside hydrolase